MSINRVKVSLAKIKVPETIPQGHFTQSLLQALGDDNQFNPTKNYIDKNYDIYKSDDNVIRNITLYALYKKTGDNAGYIFYVIYTSPTGTTDEQFSYYPIADKITGNPAETITIEMSSDLPRNNQLPIIVGVISGGGASRYIVHVVGRNFTKYVKLRSVFVTLKQAETKLSPGDIPRTIYIKLNGEFMTIKQAEKVLQAKKTTKTDTKKKQVKRK